jgi:anhydro-N-acetylmuramic acid kinase
MSGTSYDGVDVAAAQFRLDRGVLLMTPLGALELAYPPGLRGQIAALLPPARVALAQVCRLDSALGAAYGRAAAQGLAALCAGRADVVVSPGQTVYHGVDGGRAYGSLQLGRPAFVAAATGLPVLADLRAADIAAGGQGAPLVPIFDALLLAGAGTPAGGAVRAALNLGGIANVTVLTPGAAPLGYDIGPGNALLDAAARRYHGTAADLDGRCAAAGRVHPELLELLLAEPYYAAQAPKSTGKELFHPGYLDAHLARLGSPPAPDDVLATLTELTARVAGDALRRHRVGEVYVSGGGVRNPVLMARLRALAGPGCRVATSAALGVPEQAKEAYAFALLGWLSWYGLPGALPSVTGAARAGVLGSFTPGAGPLRLPEPLPSPPDRLVVSTVTA